MAGRKYPIGLFALSKHPIDAKDIIPGATGQYTRKEAEEGFFDINFFDSDDEGDIRYSYDVMDLPQSGTVFLNVTEGVQPVFGSVIQLSTTSPSQTVTDAQNAAKNQSTFFWVGWGFLMILCIGAGVYFVWFYQYPEY